MSAASKPRRKAAKGHKLPEPIPEGFLVSDTCKKNWTIGKEIGTGGFGVIYLASDDSASSTSKRASYDYVMKVEYHENGPLFTELHCYKSIGKIEQISDWVKKKKMDYLGISPCHAIGSFEYLGSKYRFLVLERYGVDLQKTLEENGNAFPAKTVFSIGISVLNVLEYIHSCGYLHGDIKPANLLLGRLPRTENQIFVVDLGLACKYLTGDGSHKKNTPDPRKAHNGTIEFTSRDAHTGACSRRSDLEILGYNLLQMLGQKLPWAGISDPVKVQQLKSKYMNDIPSLLKALFPSDDCPAGISEYLNCLKKLEFEDSPNYNHFRKILNSAITDLGCKPDGALKFETKKSTKTKTPGMKPDSEKENVRSKKHAPIKESQKRKEKAKFTLEPGVIPTPAMLAVMNRTEPTSEKSTKSRKQ